MKKLLLILSLLLLLSISFIFFNNINEVNTDDIKVKGVQQYTKPIGPTQTEPYILESEVLDGVSRAG